MFFYKKSKKKNKKKTQPNSPRRKIKKQFGLSREEFDKLCDSIEINYNVLKLKKSINYAN